ncbi:MAG: MFS transporter [Candidatus Cryptobacteroides sp.]
MRKAIPFFISQAVTLFGSQVVAFAIIWYITRETASGVWVALLTISSYLPQFIMSFFGGVLADRHSKKPLIIGADAAIALFTLAMVLIMPVLGQGSALRIALIVLALLRSVAAGIQTPAVGAAIPLLVEPDKLMRANGINSSFQAVANFAAPAAAAAVMSLLSLRSSMMIDVATAVVGIAILACISIPKAVAGEAGAGSETAGAISSGVMKEMLEGVRYALNHKEIGRLLLLFGLFIFLSVPSGFMCTLFVCRYFEDTYVNFMIMELMGFGGMMAGGVLMSTWGGFKQRHKTLLLAVLLFGSLGIAMALSPTLPVYVVLMLLYGIPLTAFQTATTTVLQETVEEKMMGRVFGLLNAMYSGFLPLGMAIFGPLADVMSLRVMMIASNAALLLLCLPLAARLKVKVEMGGLEPPSKHYTR